MSIAPRILVVDDELVVCKSCEKILQGQGYQVETATDAHTGLAIAAKAQFAAVLLDLKMPGMDGLEFLGELRKQGHTTPVIVITGYPTIESAAAAMRLGAVDYVPKPFTPPEILAAVNRMVQARPLAQAPVLAAAPASAPAAPRPAVASTPAPRPPSGPWTAAGTEVKFVGESWVAVGQDGTARVGAFLSSAELRGTNRVVLPQPGEALQRGLPLAALWHAAGDPEILFAPISGEVLEVNTARAAPSEASWGDPCSTGWLARVRPTDLAAELGAAEVRKVVVAAGDDIVLHKDATQLTGLGCQVTMARASADAIAALPATGPGLLLVDAASLGDVGPTLVRAVLENLPGVKVMVVGEWKREHEAAYRAQKIHFFVRRPFVALELLDALHATFTPPEEPAAPAPRAARNPRWIKRVRLTNRAGHQVTLLAGQGLLDERTGVGQQLVQAILQDAYPLLIGLGSEPLTSARVSAEASDSDRVLVLGVEDMAHLPGTAVRGRALDVVQQAGPAAQKVTTITVQAPKTLEHGLTYGARVDAALARYLLREMTS